MAEASILQSKVPLKYAGQTLEDYLAGRFRYKLKDEWAGAIGAGKVTVNGARAGAGQKVSHGDRVAYTVVLQEPRVDANIRIIHLEEGFLVADKPGQLPSHSTGRFVKNTFVYLLARLLEGMGEDGKVRLAHRLDRETSGLMVVARNRKSHASLMAQFEEGRVGKEYIAVAKGRIEGGPFTVSGWLGRDPASSISVRHALFTEKRPGTRDSLTEFTPLTLLKDATVVRCVPKTGRTNQIRVHLASRGHPLVGDKLYGKTDEEFLAFVRHVKAGGGADFAGQAEVPRHLLHASRLSFDHPDTGKRVSFEAPIPADMKGYMEAL